MVKSHFPVAQRVVYLSYLGYLSLGLLALGPAACSTPKTKLPPKEVPQVDSLYGNQGQRSAVIADAVQVGSNLARFAYDCAPPHGRGVEGGAVLAPIVQRCELDQATQTLTISGADATDECAPFLLTLSGYRGPSTYNTASLTALSFGLAKVRQKACSYEGTLCMNWNGQSGSHGTTNCTVEISGDGGLQYGNLGATVSGTFVCTAFLGAHKGCDGAPAVTGCGIPRGSFSVAGCVVTGQKPGAAPGPEKKKPGRRG